MGLKQFFRELIAGESDRPTNDTALLEEMAKLSTPNGTLDSAHMKQLDEEVQPYLAEEDAEAALELAGQKRQNGNELQAVYLFRKLTTHFPERRQDCEIRIGQAYFNLAKYPKAIESYIAARVHGAESRRIDRCIWETCHAMYNTCEDPVRCCDALNIYLRLCPQGEHREQAQRMLQAAMPSR